MIHILAPRSRQPPGAAVARVRHPARIGAVVGLGQAEAADPLARGELRQIFLALLLGAEIVDRVHDQARLHAHRRAIAAVDPLDLAGDQPVAT